MKNKTPLKVTAGKSSVILESGNKTVTLSKKEAMNPEQISEIFDQFGYTDEEQNKQKPIIVSAEHDEKGRLLIKTVIPEREMLIKKPWLVDHIERGLDELNLTSDDYESFCKELEAQGLPRPANAGLISGGEQEKLTLPNLNEFGHPIKKLEIDPSLFVDEKLSISDLFEFKIDVNKPLFSLPEDLDLSDLFEFEAKTKKKAC